MAEGRAVFWDLGLAEKEKDPTDPLGKRFQAICKCKVDKDDPTITCNKKIGMFYLNFIETFEHYLKYPKFSKITNCIRYFRILSNF
jgi:hypothetical protein